MARIRLLLLGVVVTTTSGCCTVTDLFDRSLLGQALGRSTVVSNNLCSYPQPCGPTCGPSCCPSMGPSCGSGYGPGYGPGPGISEFHGPAPELLAPPKPMQHGPLAKPVPYNP